MITLADRRLSPHFWLSELTVTSHPIDNTPTEDHLENLTRLANALEFIREDLGNKPIIVTSAYRSARLNAVIPGASTTSEHMVGRAVDFVCPSFGNPLAVCERLAVGRMGFNQLIHEWRAWTHFSIPALGQAARMQLCTMDERGWYGEGLR